MRRLFLVALVIALFTSTCVAYAAPPSDSPSGSAQAPFVSPPGLAKAIAAQEKHNPQLLTTPGVVGTAVGLGADGTAVVRVFTERPGVRHVPSFLDGVPVLVQATGKLSALKKPAGKPGGGKGKNAAPTVAISSPTDGAEFGSGDSVHFVATATDDRDGDLSDTIAWTSSIDGSLGTGATIDYVLSDGTHTITASATDSRRKTGTHSITVIVGGSVEPPATTDFWPRPVPIGVSTGNYQSSSAGTIACRVKDPDSGHVYALSNTHVYAPNDIDGQGELGDIVTQPGLYDVANHAYDPSLHLGEVSAYKPIDGSILAVNDIDAAIALTDSSKLGNSTPEGGYGIPNAMTKTAALNMAVQKFGRTTQLTEGTVTGINATMVVAYADNWYAWFGGQIIVEKPAGGFILPGDSGSLMLTDDGAANPVGLLFAGNADGTMAIANPIDSVLDHFGVVIDGTE